VSARRAQSKESAETRVSPANAGAGPERAPWAFVAGGGTAGHVLPGIAVANELVERGHAAEGIHFVGAERGIEGRLVPEAGFGITLLPGRGIQRRLTLENLAAVWGLVRALFMAISLVRRHRPQVVLVLGGFAAAACAFAAVLWRVPIVVTDQNARAGAVNRLVGRFAAACAVPFAATDLPKAVVTGNPVRPQILETARRRDPAASRAELGLPADGTVLAVFAGSLGSRRLNEATTAAVLGAWADRGDLVVHHVVGARDWDEREQIDGGVTDGRRGSTAVDYRAIRYEERMDLVLDAADMVVCRSGGTTVAELAVMGTPAVLVPLPIATRDHQRANAAELVEAGAAVLVSDADFDADRLVAEVDAVLGDETTLLAMGAAARELGRPDAAAAVADLVELHAR